jgi:hypothetical protein
MMANHRWNSQNGFFSHRRAVTTENVDGFCAVMNIGCAVMEEEFCSMLRSSLK